jgi:hypothetical protein
MDLHLFRPAIDSKGLLSVNGTDVLPHLGISFGLVLDGGFGILPFHGFVNSNDTTAAEADYCGGRGDGGILCDRPSTRSSQARCTSTSASRTCSSSACLRSSMAAART